MYHQSDISGVESGPSAATPLSPWSPLLKPSGLWVQTLRSIMAPAMLLSSWLQIPSSGGVLCASLVLAHCLSHGEGGMFSFPLLSVRSPSPPKCRVSATSEEVHSFFIHPPKHSTVVPIYSPFHFPWSQLPSQLRSTNIEWKI